ncbi:MAG: two-component system response regulator OmpR [Burkholderiales bacterium RIFCSPHIGHO2_12_FULL_69_20]|nr:MAG: two-component system response regulator OmpR [Burkholderiales bacterium RIFCSPHIGHO2_12_FULL_69_20]
MDTPAKPRILVVDDDPALCGLLADYLGASGFDVDTAGDGRQMRERMALAWPDALVLDLMLPGEDGLTLARALRQTSALPILMLSARGEEIDRVVGLEMGADDYLAKPFSPRELLARLRALLRRAQAAPLPPVLPLADAAAGPAAGHYPFGPFVLDTLSWRLMRGADEVAVTSAEFALLRLFVQHPHRVLSRDHLIEQLKGYERDAFDRSIDVRVTRLRRKIEADPAHPVYVRTVRGEGYLFNPAGEGRG